MSDPFQLIAVLMLSIAVLSILGVSAMQVGVDSRPSIPDDHRR
jgi:Tfp pilus assembly protein PilX